MSKNKSRHAAYIPFYISLGVSLVMAIVLMAALAGLPLLFRIYAVAFTLAFYLPVCITAFLMRSIFLFASARVKVLLLLLLASLSLALPVILYTILVPGI